MLYKICKYLFCWLTICLLGACNNPQQTFSETNWVNELKGDFSFKDKWDYAETTFKNEKGQLVCDGICPEACDRMKDSTGTIIKDSVSAYYKLIDTTHVFNSIACDAWCYEYAGTDRVMVLRKNADTVFCSTECSPATHCSLNLLIVGKECTPKINLVSVKPNGKAVFFVTQGHITIDRLMWEKGILKAEFDYLFDDPEARQKQVYWKGKIYAPIK